MARPPYIRWILVGLLVVVSLWLEIRPVQTVRHPYLTRDLVAGEPVAGALEWREIAGGVLEPVSGTGFAGRSLVAGQPLLRGDTVATAKLIPPGWWVLDLPVPSEAVSGTRIQLVVLPDGDRQPVPPIGGIVTDVRSPEYGGDETIGSVAFPPDRAATAAVAIAGDNVAVLLEASGIVPDD